MTAPTSVGDIVGGKYRVERVLGRGGMGVVVVARHLRLGEVFAIKFPVARMGNGGDVLARWVREGRAAMRIRSQHVARVYDVGTLETGEPYLVMEYLEGRDLAAVVAIRGPLTVEEAIEYVLQAIEALAEAHAQGIVHRDIKPSNLFLTRGADASAVTKVLDFGAAKALTLGADTSVTAPGGVVGTPLFMAPEQMRSTRDVDARADIWALGATLHALLTGRPPFSAGSIVEIHECIQRGAPRLRASRPDAPEALEAILLRCMQTDPAHRYGSVAELAGALAGLVPERMRVSADRAARILSAPPVARTVDSGDADAHARGPVSSDTEAVGYPTLSSASASWLEMVAGTTATSIAPPAPPTQGAANRLRAWTTRGLLVVILVGAGGLLGVAVATRTNGSSASPAFQDRLRAPPPTPLPPSGSADRPVERTTATEPSSAAEPAGNAYLAPPPPRSFRGSPAPQGSRPATTDAAAPSPGPPPARDPLADPN
jgi:serine/threonine-protein kinase